jgi:hypothetical protein
MQVFSLCFAAFSFEKLQDYLNTWPKTLARSAIVSILPPLFSEPSKAVANVTLLPQNIPTYISPNKEILLYNHNIMIKLKKCKMDTTKYLEYNPYLNFSKCPFVEFFSNPVSSPEASIAFSSLISSSPF